MIELIPLVLLLPAAGALINAFYPQRSVARIVGPGVVGAAFVVALIVLVGLLALPPEQRSRDVVMWPWIPGSGLGMQRRDIVVQARHRRRPPHPAHVQFA